MFRMLLMTTLLSFSAVAVADTETEIRTALDYLTQVWNESDLEAIAAYYHSNFQLITDDGIVSRAQLLDEMAQIGARGGDRGKVQYSNVAVQSLGEGHAVAWGKMKLSFEDGSAIENWFSTVYEKTPFGWKAVLTHN